MRSRGGRRRSRLWAALLGTVAALSLAMLPGCSQDGEWAQQALQWIEARDRAAHRSVADLLMFESEDGEHLFCCNQMGPVQGREALAAFISTTFGETVDEEIMGRAYIDVSGVVVEYRYPPVTDEVGSPADGVTAVHHELQVLEIASDGTATRTVHATALQSLESTAADDEAFYGKSLGAARTLTDRYLTAWSGEDGAAVAEVYAENATLLDSLLGVRLTGRAAIGSYAADHAGPWLEEDPIPHSGGPALYGYWAGSQSDLTAYLTYTGEQGIQCPGSVTTELQIEQGEIVAERRYHDVASMRRCVDSGELPDGWWTSATIPPPIQDRVTGRVSVAGQQVEVRNGTDAAEDLARWAIARFSAAQLDAPVVASVAFSEDAHQAQCSGDDRGLALKLGSKYEVYLCLTVDRTVPPSARNLILHELAHVWMWQNLTESPQREFLARTQLPTWDATTAPWDQRGFEHAAAVIAWGVGEESLVAPTLASRSCAELAELFELLTGVPPLQTECAPRE